MNTNSYMKILKENKVNVSKFYEDGFPVYKKSKQHGTIVKFTNLTTGSIIRESDFRDSRSRDNNGSLGKLGYCSDRWVRCHDTYSWIDLTHEESMKFDENYRKREEDRFDAKQKLEAMRLLMPSFMHDNINFDNEVIEALVNISGIGKK